MATADRLNLASIAEGIDAQMQDLVLLSRLRIDDRIGTLFSADLASLEEVVRHLDAGLKRVRRAVADEKASIPKALLDALNLQKAQLDFMHDNLPEHLPSASNDNNDSSEPAVAPSAAPDEDDRVLQASTKENIIASTSCAGQELGGEAHIKHTAPRRYITNDELAGLSTYMTARLTLQKVNSAVDEAGSLAEANAKQLAMCWRAGSKPTGSHQAKLIAITNKDVIQRRPWFCEAGMKGAKVLRPDKTGKALLTILRHLGRLQEVRVTVDNGLQPIYILI